MGVDIVQRVGHAVELGEELAVEKALSFGTDAVLKRRHVHVGVHHFDGAGCGVRLGILHVPRAKQERSVQVLLLNAIYIGHVDAAILSGSDVHHGEVLEQLATDGSRTDDKVLQGVQLLLEFRTENSWLCFHRKLPTKKY